MVKISKVTKSTGFKLFLVGILVLIMLIPVGLVVQVVRERARRAEMVEAEIVSAWGGELVFGGAVLKLPCMRKVETVTTDQEGKQSVESTELPFTLWITPEVMNIEGILGCVEKNRGIFSVPVFNGELGFTGNFNLSGAIEELGEGERLLPGEAEIIFAFEDQKVIRGLNSAGAAGGLLVFEPGDSGFNLLPGGINADIDLSEIMSEGNSFPFNVNISVQGGRRLEFLPLAGNTAVSIDSDWSAPSYQGAYLPSENSHGKEGFEAFWQVSNLSRGIPLYWEGALHEDGRFGTYFFGVDFLEVLDRYGKNERAVKYALLFIIVPFLMLFLFEIFHKTEIHPVQYLLTGIGNIVFYLLLLALSEHIPFNAAYSAGALAVTLMIWLYFRSMLKGGGRSWLMIPVMAASYLYLFITLQSEDWALLIGAVGLFAVIGTVMFVTRNVDWYMNRKTQEF